MKKQRSKWGLLGIVTLSLVCSSGTILNAGETRVLRFPADQSLGIIKVWDGREVPEELYWWWGHLAQWDTLAEARGDVVVPADKWVGLVVNRNTWGDLSPLKGLGPNDLQMLSIQCGYRESDPPGDACMAHVSHLSGLKMLLLEHTGVSSKGLSRIAGFRSIERLIIQSKILDNAGLVHIGRLTTLKGLRLYLEKATNAGMVHLQSLRSLEELFLGGGNNLSGEALQPLMGRLPKLNHLYLSGDLLDEVGIEALGQHQTLTTLKLSSKPLNEPLLKILCTLPELKSLETNGAAGDEALETLCTMKSLQELRLCAMSLGRTSDYVTDAGLASLAEIKSLEVLELRCARCTDAGLRHLAKLPKLRSLSIHGGTFSNSGLVHLTRISSLEALRIKALNFTDEGLNHLARLSNLKRLTLNWARSITDTGLVSLSTIKTLESLAVVSDKFTSAGLNQLNDLPTLKQLNAGPGQGEIVLAFGNLRQLEDLRICVFSDRDLVFLAQLHKLKDLEIECRGPVTDEGIRHLQGLTSLRRLRINNALLTDKGLATIGALGRQESFLTVSGDFTPQGLEPLKNLHALKQLQLTSVRPLEGKALDDLKHALPNLDRFSIEVQPLPSFAELKVKVGAKLPSLDKLGLTSDPATDSNNRILVCFFDMQQRPSRRCVIQLARQAKSLQEKGVTPVAVHGTVLDDTVLKQWIKENTIPFPVGLVQGEHEKVKLAWGIRSMPWLILTDKERIVRAEGFGIDELDKVIE
jgi:internalin A